MSYFFFNDTATTEIYTLSLHDALPIPGLLSPASQAVPIRRLGPAVALWLELPCRGEGLRVPEGDRASRLARDRKSTRLNSSHANISYAVFCLKKKTSAPALPRPRSAEH